MALGYYLSDIATVRWFAGVAQGGFESLGGNQVGFPVTHCESLFLLTALAKHMPDKANQARDDVLRRMLKTPPAPHKPIGKPKKASVKTNKVERKSDEPDQADDQS